MQRLIACSDGTWKSAESETLTNVVYMKNAIAKLARDGTRQEVFYDAGVGTGSFLDRFTGGAFGRGLDDNIKDVYRFFAANYQPGDQLFLFGFSRGAYTARSAVGLIRKCGILKPANVGRLDEAFALYRQRDDTVDGAVATNFRTAYSWPDPQIAFIGVWDTVGGLGIPLAGLRWVTRQKYQFHDTKLSGIVKRAYHAVAIDERRGSFKPTLWQTKADPQQIVEQAWFAGVHSDVGGGYKDRGLADITFEWMASRAADAGIDFDPLYLKTVMGLGLPHTTEFDTSKYAAQIHDSRDGIYRFMPTFTRTIGADVSHKESVWQSALTRFEDAALNYRPRNLGHYLAKPERVIAGPAQPMPAVVLAAAETRTAGVG